MPFLAPPDAKFQQSSAPIMQQAQWHIRVRHRKCTSVFREQCIEVALKYVKAEVLQGGTYSYALRQTHPRVQTIRDTNTRPLPWSLNYDLTPHHKNL